MGYDVWPVNTVDFSNHTGYGKWHGQVFSGEHVKGIVDGIINLGVSHKCQGILSGYMGSRDICEAVYDIVKSFKTKHPNILYLCDPVIGDGKCYVKPEVLEFFKQHLHADVITPNQYEAEVLSGMKVHSVDGLKRMADHFHNIGIKIVVITGIKIPEVQTHELAVFMSTTNGSYMIKVPKYKFTTQPTGTGDLLSALFLGHLVKTQDPVEALRHTVYFIDKAVNNTLTHSSPELMVTSVHYDSCNKELLPCAIPL
jgi:pyridoxine kinase